MHTEIFDFWMNSASLWLFFIKQYVRNFSNLTFKNGHVHPAQAFLLVSVHVISEGVSCLLPRLNESLVKGMVGLPSGHMKRSTASPVPTVNTMNVSQRGEQFHFKILYGE